MVNPKRGEIWLIDLGLAAKTRPCLVLSVHPNENERALCTLVAHTTSTRTTRFEVKTHVQFLHSGAFDAQNLITIPKAKFLRKLGKLPSPDLQAVEDAVRLWLGL